MGRSSMEVINRQYTNKNKQIKVAEILNDISSELKKCLRNKIAVKRYNKYIIKLFRINYMLILILNLNFNIIYLKDFQIYILQKVFQYLIINFIILSIISSDKSF